MSEDELSMDESKYAQDFLDALFKRDKEKNKNLQGLDKVVGYERGREPELVMKCIDAPNRSAMMWYSEGYCLCSRFYKCRYQSGGFVIIDGRERAVCNKYDFDQTQCCTGESI